MATDMETTSGSEGTLSTWAGPYITDMLGRAQAYAQLPYQPYTGALTAGPSQLQTQAFQGIGGLTVPSSIGQAASTLTGLSTQPQQAYQAGSFSPTAYSQQAIQPYMNPYLESVLAPQRRAAEEAATKARMETQGRMAQAGAYGGSRQAIMESEGQKNLQQLLSDITGKGYASAFDIAQQQFANEQARLLDAARFGEQSRQFGAGLGIDQMRAQTAAAQAAAQAGGLEAQYGLQNLQEMAKQGGAQREIEQQGLTADYNQYLRELNYPQEMLQFERQMISGIPGIASQSYYQPAQSAFQSATGGASTVLELLKLLGQV